MQSHSGIWSQTLLACKDFLNRIQKALPVKLKFYELYLKIKNFIPQKAPLRENTGNHTSSHVQDILRIPINFLRKI